MKRYKVLRKPYRIKKKKSPLKSRFLWLPFLTLIIFGGIFYFCLFSDFFQIKKIIITGEEKVSTEELRLLVEKNLENKIFFFKTKSILLIDTQKIRKIVLDNFLAIAEVEIKQGFPDGVDVVVIERLGLANWCQEEKCFLIDNEGVIFEEIRQREDLIKIIDRQKINPPILREKVIEKANLEQILKIALKLKEDLKIPLEEVVIVSEQRLNVKTLEDWEIYFDPKEDLNWQITKLKVVLENKIPLEKRKNLEYIDLRFEKVYIFPEGLFNSVDKN